MKKAQLTGNRVNRGVSTLEILIAFAILTLSITAVVVVGFGNQTVSADAEVSKEALERARAMLEDARALSRADFFSLTSTSTSEASGPLTFSDALAITDVTECRKDAVADVSWTLDNRSLAVTLPTFFTDISGAQAQGGDCDVEPPREWDNPNSPESVNITGQSNATDIDVQDGLVFITTDPGGHGKDNFFVYEFDDIALSLDEVGTLEVDENLNALDVAGDYAYVATASTSVQLVVIDVSDPTPSAVAQATLPDLTNGIARSVAYYDNKIYIGTQYVPCVSCSPERNNEFHIYDVSNPADPTWLGSLDVDHNINDIMVQGDYAYLATSDDTGELMIVDISDPSNLTHPDDSGMKYDASGDQDGYSVYVLGQKVHLGMRRSGQASNLADFYVLDISSPASISPFGSRDLGISNNSEIVGIRVRSNLAFLAVNQPTFGFKILNISDPSIPDHIVCVSTNFSENTSGIDMEGNFIFVSNRSNAEIRVITDQSSQCPA